ncbi:MMPL family transporter [Frederiksenia canicola]
MKKLTACRWLYALFLLAIGFFLVRNLSHIQTDLQALLPQEQHWNKTQQTADKYQEQQFAQQIVALVGHSDAQQAFQLAQNISQQWQISGLFSQIDSQTQPDLAELRKQIQQISLATLPESIRQQLLQQPIHYFQQYAEQLVDPFSTPNLLSFEQDPFGFGRFALNSTQKMQWDSQTGMVYLQQADRTWVLIRGILMTSDVMAQQSTLLDLLSQNQQVITQAQGQFLATGSAIFAAYAKQAAEKESLMMSGLGISLTLLLLFGVFRSLRVLWLFLPIGIGMAVGVVVTIGFFGQIHILTLVVGTSLIGVLIDFPLHWLSSALFTPQWQPQQAMNHLRKTFLISLIVTLLGYALLGFTALPVLKQTALFSAAALVAAMLATLLYLPPIFQRYSAYKRSVPSNILQITLPKKRVWLLTATSVVLVSVGLYKSQWQDDIRQWVAIPPELVQQLQQIGELTGMDFGSQYFLLTAENDQALLEKSQKISQELAALQTQYRLEKFQSLNQWLLTETQQTKFAQQLAERLKSSDYQPLLELGLPLELFEHSQKKLRNRPLVSLQQALQTQMGQAWQSLYLGEIQPQQVAAVIKVSGVQDVAEMQELANQQDIFWQDKRSHLNETFQQTRDQAAWLKLLSFVLAGVLLWRLFGGLATLKMLLVPLIAIVCVVAILGYLNVPIGLFTMFGLLLVSAISIDYTAYLHTAPEAMADKRKAVLLAATTTMISFVLLGFSHTPAVATFGLSVSLGVGLSLLFSFKFFK